MEEKWGAGICYEVTDHGCNAPEYRNINFEQYFFFFFTESLYIQTDTARNCLCPPVKRIKVRRELAPLIAGISFYGGKKERQIQHDDRTLLWQMKFGKEKRSDIELWSEPSDRQKYFHPFSLLLSLSSLSLFLSLSLSLLSLSPLSLFLTLSLSFLLSLSLSLSL